jgi:hypothetical protein
LPKYSALTCREWKSFSEIPDKALFVPGNIRHFIGKFELKLSYKFDYFTQIPNWLLYELQYSYELFLTKVDENY